MTESHTLAGFGNAIKPQAAAAFIGAYMKTTPARQARVG